MAALTAEADVEMPMLNLQTGGIDHARLADRDAILVRTDLPPGRLRVANPQSGHFENHIVFPAIGPIRRGGFVPKSESVVDDALGGAAPPRWPLDHAGVFASFRMR